MTNTNNNQPSTTKSKFLKQALGVVIALLFLYLAFKGADPEKLWYYIKSVQPMYLVLVMLCSLLSHFLRALRWTLLLKPLSEKKISLWNSFCAVMYGYAVNVVIPRGGEVARLISISKTDNLPWIGVLSTMFIDRLLDIALLMLLLGFTLIVFPNNLFSGLTWLVPGGIALTCATIFGLLLLPHMANIINWLLKHPIVQSRLPKAIIKKIEDIALQFDSGCQSLKNPVIYPAIAALSLAIWFFYWLNFYLMVGAFNLAKQVSATQCLTIFTAGSAGVLVPTPGNVGSFHFLVSQGLVLICGINKDQALAFASTLHLISFVIVTCIPAFICFIIQNNTLKNKTTS